ncbi:hypothetical protein [uncultured Polaribacter sp.]|uniref:hypothetical protein n=1 Tax=uncultured Polaribacter sp. TaxID=174711 RepID=UPI002635130F|nr:hypothetical protein [uncultured Polaribacter sp.]
MKKTICIISAFVFMMACTDKKKKEEKKIEDNIQKIDSIEADVIKNIESLKNTIKDIELDLKKLDNI